LFGLLNNIYPWFRLSTKLHLRSEVDGKPSAARPPAGERDECLNEHLFRSLPAARTMYPEPQPTFSAAHAFVRHATWREESLLTLRYNLDRRKSRFARTRLFIAALDGIAHQAEA
jgi:hypothetical protein